MREAEVVATTFPYPESRPAVLVASSQKKLRSKILNVLNYAQWRTLEAYGGADALSKLEESGCQILLLDEALPDLQAAEVGALARANYPGLAVVLMDGVTGEFATSDCPANAVVDEMIRLLVSPEGEKANLAEDLPPRKLPVNAAGTLASSPRAATLPGMVGSSPEMHRVYQMVRLVAPRSTPVLILGPTGSGKELVARAIHELSPRSGRPLITINCAAIPESLLEAELFGYLRGAFTGAVQSRVGRIHSAHGGTLFLDEIGELPVNLQSKLLRFLENGEIQRLGSSDVFRVDVRVVAATNVDLEQRVRAHTFREDLFYRLSVFPVVLPPLTRRGRDVVLLAENFLKEMCPQLRFSPAALERLLQHRWPGNVRELRHVVERAVILAESNAVIGPEHLMLSQWEATA
jgi:transcriptional regulator with GAF, ATPase, and Fis domain